MTTTTTTAMAASAATVASANASREESPPTPRVLPSRDGTGGERGRGWGVARGLRRGSPRWFARPGTGTHPRGDPATPGGSRYSASTTVRDRPTTRDATPPDASPANQLPRASPGPNGSRQDRPTRPRLDGVPGHDHVPNRHAGSRRCATATPIVSKPDALAPTATHPGATFAFERSDSNCQKIVAAATRSFSPDPSTCSRPSIHSTASPR